MINGIHALVYTKAPEKVRAFFRDVLELSSVDAGGGWPIYALPPAELGVHASDGEQCHQLYLMCDDVRATVAELKRKGVKFSQPIVDQGWGLVTSIKMPGGAELGLYEPKYATPHKLKKKAKKLQPKGKKRKVQSKRRVK